MSLQPHVAGEDLLATAVHTLEDLAIFLVWAALGVGLVKRLLFAFFETLLR